MALVCALALVAPSVGADPDPLPEYEVKAAFLYNFAKFVEWPAVAFVDPASPLVIGVLGEDPFGGALDRSVTGRDAGTHRVSVRHVKSDVEVPGCHILFLPAGESSRLRDVLAAAAGHPVLTVTELDSGRWAGGVINFTIAADRVRFEIDAAAGEHAGLHLSAKLLAVASAVNPPREARR